MSHRLPKRMGCSSLLLHRCNPLPLRSTRSSATGKMRSASTNNTGCGYTFQMAAFDVAQAVVVDVFEAVTITVVQFFGVFAITGIGGCRVVVACTSSWQPMISIVAHAISIGIVPNTVTIVSVHWEVAVAVACPFRNAIPTTDTTFVEDVAVAVTHATDASAANSTLIQFSAAAIIDGGRWIVVTSVCIRTSSARFKFT